MLPYVDSDLKKIAARVIEQAKEICATKSVDEPMVEIMEGDARNVLCEAVEKYRASILVVGSHGYVRSRPRRSAAGDSRVVRICEMRIPV
nr:universal stress protein PHOS34 [Ipomoea batatas]